VPSFALAKFSVYKSKSFARFARKTRIKDRDLWETVRLVHAGAIDANLGGGVIKQRIARAGQGKSGGSRAVALFRFKGRIVFVYGFEKKDRENIDARELEAFKELANVILGYSDAEIRKRVIDGALIEVQPPLESEDAEEIS
jgi:hypothetical protein